MTRHVDLALSDLQLSGGLLGAHLGPLDMWSRPVSVAAEPCLVVDAVGVVLAASPACEQVFDLDPRAALGRRLLDGVLHLYDFSGVAAALPRAEAEKIPPLLAATTGGLARGLMRVRGPGGLPHTVDAISVPLRDGGVVGSLSFFALVSR
jgi:PAS domain-containing protein